MNGPICHFCPIGGTDDQIATFLGNGWTKEDVANIRGLYDTLEGKLLVPEDKEGKKLTDTELTQYGIVLAAYKQVVCDRHLKELSDSTNHPAKAFERLYKVDGWNEVTRNNRINMVVQLFSQAVTRRQKELAAQGIHKTREEICNGYKVDKKKTDGQFSIFEEVFYELYERLKKATEENNTYAVAEYRKVLNNWGALCSFARMRIRDKEGIKLGNKIEYAAASSTDDFSVDDPSDDSYILDESIREAWMVHQAEMSAFSGLGAEVRRFLANVPFRETVKVGDKLINREKQDDLGFQIYYDPVTAHQYLADKFRGFRTEHQIIRVLAEHINNPLSGDPVLQDVGQALLVAADVPEVRIYDRNNQPRNNPDGTPMMRRKFPKNGEWATNFPRNGSIITQMLTDLHSNMVPFTAMFKGDYGLFIKRLNRTIENVDFTRYLDQVKYGVPTDKRTSIFDDGGDINWENFVKWYDEVIKMVPRKVQDANFVFSRTEIYAQGEEGQGFWSMPTSKRIDFLQRALSAVGISISDQDVTKLYHNRRALKKVLTNLSKAATWMIDSTLGEDGEDTKLLRKAIAGTLTAAEKEELAAKKKKLSTSSKGRTMNMMLNIAVGKDKTEPVKEAIGEVFDGVGAITGSRGIERRTMWYDRNGKPCSRYSDMTPSYMGDMMDDIKAFVEKGDGYGLQEYLREKWGNDSFFWDKDYVNGKDKKGKDLPNGNFRNVWLRELYNSVNSNGTIDDNSFAATFAFAEFLGSNVDQKPTNFENFSEKFHAIAMLKNFLQRNDVAKGKSQYADYPSFILGDAGVQRFFTAKRYSIDEIVYEMKLMYDQELERMSNARMLKESLRKRGIVKDDNSPDEKNMPESFVGSEDVFTTLMFLNPTFTNPEYFNMIAGTNYTAEQISKLSKEELAEFQRMGCELIQTRLATSKNRELLDKAIRKYVEDSLIAFKDKLVEHGVLGKNGAGQYFDKDGIFENNINNIHYTDINDLISDFFWNTKFATMQQIQMFTVDTSFYMSVKDLQKRYKEIYAPGKPLSTEARDYDGKLYTDREYEDVRYFEDLDSDAKERPEFHEALDTKFGKDSSVHDDKHYGASSVTDGQAYRTLKSYRAIMGMQGKWTRTMEEAYKKIDDIRKNAQNGRRDLTADEVQELANLMVILQPTKPYLFTMEKVDVGNGRTVLVPVQHKYAEVVLIPELMQKGKLKDMAEWMEDNDVDLLMSTKCVKVGAFGACDIKGITDKTALRNALDKSIPHQLSLADYRIQTGVPEHLNQNQLFGTQIRKLIYSGIKRDANYNKYLKNIFRNYKGEGELKVYIPGVGMRTLHGNDIINLYNCLIMANMFDSFEELEAHASTNEQLSDVLMQNAISDARQNDDVMMGLSIDDNGDFIFPIGDPTMEHDTAAKIISLFKKGVNKQKIHGGSAVQVAPLGKVEDGGLREVCSVGPDGKYNNVLYEEIEVTWNLSYRDYNGNQIPLKFSDYCFASSGEHHDIGDLLPALNSKGEPIQIIEKDDPEWEEYQSFTYKKVNGKWEPCAYNDPEAKVIKPKVEMDFPGILDMIAYRIPTERLYSTINCKIKRFSHPLMGGTLKVPVSGTTKAGFDFDIDKLYFFMKDFSMEHFTKEQVDKIWHNEEDKTGIYDKNPELYKALLAVHKQAVHKQKLIKIARDKYGEDAARIIKEMTPGEEVQDKLYKYWSAAVLEGDIPVSEKYGDNPSEFFRQHVEDHKNLFPTPFDEYDPEKSPSENSSIARNNLIIGLMRERLKDEETFKERYTPGGFPKLSSSALDMRFLLYGDVNEITDEKGRVDLDEISKLSAKVVSKERKDPEPEYDYSDPSTILIYNQMNQIAAKLIGIFANQNTHHVFCSAMYKLELTESIAFGNHWESGLTDFLHKEDGLAEEIDVNMAELLAAAVDAVKDPVLNYLNLNIVTADSAAMLIRLGYSQQEIGLLFNQPIIKELCEEVANNGTSVKTAINKIYKKYEPNEGDWNELDYDASETSVQQLADNILDGRKIKDGTKKANTEYKIGQLHVLKLFNQIQGAASEMNSFVQATRFTAANSIDSTWGGIIAMLDRTMKFAETYNQQTDVDATDKSNAEPTTKLRILPVKPVNGGSVSVLNTDDRMKELSSEEYAEQNYDNPFAFEQCMYDQIRKMIDLFGPHYPHFTDLYTDVKNRLAELTEYGTLDGDTINSAFRELMVMLLSLRKGTDFNGESKLLDYPNLLANRLTDHTFLTNRKFYTEEFPEIMEKVLTSEAGMELAKKSEFFSRLDYSVDPKTRRTRIQIKGVGGLQSVTSNSITGAWYDAFNSDESITVREIIEETVTDEHGNPVRNPNGSVKKKPKIIESTYAIKDLAKGMYFYNLYRLGFNFHATSTMHLTPVMLKTSLKIGDKKYVDFVNDVINGRVDIDRDHWLEFIDFYSKQYLLNHPNNYKFTYTVHEGTPISDYLKKVMNGMPDSFTLDFQELHNNGYANLLILQESSTEEYLDWKPMIVFQVGNVKHYYMAVSGSSTRFNETDSANPNMKYVKVQPQGVKGDYISYYDSDNFSFEQPRAKVLYQNQDTLPFLRELTRFFRISRGGLSQIIDHMKGMGMKVHTLREMLLFMEHRPYLIQHYAIGLAELEILGTLGVDAKKMISLLGSRMYNGSVQAVAEKELILNAFDAVKAAMNLGQQRRGKIKLDINEEDRTITISDNGTGMTPEIVQNAFFTIGGTDKSGLSAGERSGGLGLAKIQFLFSSESIHLETVRDGQQVVVDATSLLIMNNDFTLKISKTDKPNGTSVTVKIPQTYIDSKGATRQIWFDNYPNFVDRRPIIGNVDIEVTTHSPSGKERTLIIDCSRVPDGYKFVGSAQTDFGLIDIYVNPSDRRGMSASSSILSAGLYLFSKTFKNGTDYIKTPFILNIRPTVEADSEIYPINNQREGFSPGVSAEISDLQHFLGALDANIERLLLTEQFDSAFSMDVDDVNVDESNRKETDYVSVVQKAINETNKNFLNLNNTSKEEATDEQNILTPSDEKIIGSGEIHDTKTMRLSSFVPPKVQMDGRRSAVDTSRFDISKPIFHNNTTLKLSDEAKTYSMEVGRLMIKLRELYKKFYSDDPTDVFSRLNGQFWGISLDKDYGGINVNPTLFNFLAINPFYMSGRRDYVESKLNMWKRGDLAEAIASHTFHLIFHEFNHNYVSGEGSAFTGRLPDTEAEFRLMDGFEDWYSELLTLVRNNIETIIKTSLDYAESNNAGKSLEGSGITKDSSGQEEFSYGGDERQSGNDGNVQRGELPFLRSRLLQENDDFLPGGVGQTEGNQGITERLRKATVIWGHPGIGKTHFFKNGGDKEVIDFDTVYKSRINKELGLPEGPEARKQWRREHRAEYKQKLFDLFDLAIADAKRTGKKLLVSDMVILRERESDLDVITQMTEENFAQRSEQRNEPYDANKKLWKQDIDEAIANVSDKSKIIETNAYFSDLYDIKLLQTPSGEVYGFVYQGEIYIDETKLDPQVPIHEYTHIWDEAVILSNPRLWERGKRLLKDSNNRVLRNLWNEIAESDAYGKKWLAQGKTEEEIENLTAGEVHARLVGERGAELLEQIEKARGGRGLIGRLRRWLADVFKHLAKTFGTWDIKSLNNLTLEDFLNMPLRDFLDGVNPNNYIEQQYNQLGLSGATLLNPEYRGKLIYAQDGSGKSTVADNVTVFDSDYLLGEVIGVSPQTARFFFNSMSKNQKEVFGKEYRNSIREKLQDGFTVLTADKDLMQDADVVVYHKSAQQAEERVNSYDRVATERYSALNYHLETIDLINQLRENETDKEYIELDEGYYLGNVLQSDGITETSDSGNIGSAGSGSQSDVQGQLESGLTQEQLITDFLDTFGITVNDLGSYDGDTSLFDALARTINVRNSDEITDGVGYAIAFMMQSDPEMRRIIRGKSRVANRLPGHLRATAYKMLDINQEVIRETGAIIADELRQHYGETISRATNKTQHKSIWRIIQGFFRKLLSSSNMYGAQRLFAKDIVEALTQGDFSRVLGPNVKPGTTELALRVKVEQVFEENPFEVDIIRRLSDRGIALGGSLSIALEGTLYRPSENLLHDLDFNAGNDSSKLKLDKLLPDVFGKDRIAFSSMISRGTVSALLHGWDFGTLTVTYVTLDTDFVVRNHRVDGHTIKEEYYSKDGKYLGKRDGSELYLEDGVKGKLLDFFVGKDLESKHGFYNAEINGENYLMVHHQAAMAAKILWARPKDMWDYKRFVSNEYEASSDVEGDYVGKEQSEFNHDEATYLEEPMAYSPHQMFSEQEWSQLYNSLAESNPLMSNLIEKGLFSKEELILMFVEGEQTNQTLLEEITRGLDDGSIKPMTIDENGDDIPLCM